MYDLSMLGHRKNLADALLADVERFSVFRNQEERRKHLGISNIGEKCSRQLYYKFRWAKQENNTGREKRLFERGHLEEIRFRKYLTGIGCVFEQSDTDEQLKFSGCEGHFGGSLDNTGFLPKKYNIDERVLFEYKTMAEKYFKDFKKDGLKIAFPEYWSQHCTYGYKAGIGYGVMVVVNKNNDEWGIEVNKLDIEHGKYCEEKALQIITSNPANPPAKISLSSANFACKWCDFKQICHYEAAVDINCRSCEHAQPMAGAKWGCNLYKLEIPDNVIMKGCNSHKGIK